MAEPEGLLWTYQPQFLMSALEAARNLFNALDAELEPQVGLLTVSTDPANGRDCARIYPDDLGYEPDAFKNLCIIAQQAAAEAEQRYLVFIDVGSPYDYERNLRAHSVRSAAQGILREREALSDFVSFCSWPAAIGGQLACLILRLDRSAFVAHYALTRDLAFERYPIATSLITAAVAEFLDGCAKALAGPNPGAEHDILGRDADELIRAAGKRLMRTPIWATGGHDIGNLFEAVNTISSLTYEGEEITGRLILARRSHASTVADISLRRPIELRDFRAIRKLMEISSDDLALISDGANVYGFGRITGDYDLQQEDLFLIRFVKHFTWELQHAGQVLMRVAYGQPHVPRFPVREHKFKSDLVRIFVGIAPHDCDVLWSLVRRAGQQKRGTMLVISAGAAEEAERLQAQCTRIEPIAPDDRLLGLITAIDGAVLVDMAGRCYAIGVILDGVASSKGTPARGARFNSAVRYVEYTSHSCLAVVISEDGTIDLVPDLPPEVPRDSIEAVISTLRNLARADRPDPRTFQRCMEWLSDHRDYLWPQACAEINSLKAEIGQRIREQASSFSHLMSWDDFVAAESHV